MKRMGWWVAVMVGCLLPACGASTDMEDQDGAHSSDEPGVVKALYWTGWTSEEFPPLDCDAGSLVSGIECSGGYCDNIRLNCTGSVSQGASYWTNWFSEEGAYYRYCGANEWMTGIACNGGWCDNISFECTYVPNRTVGVCYWSGVYSEENPPFQAPAGYYVRGIACYGGRCDNKRYYYCRLN